MPDSTTAVISADNQPITLLVNGSFRAGVSIQLAGNFVGTVNFFASTNGSQYEYLRLVNTWTGEVADHGSVHSQWEGSCAGKASIRVVGAGWQSGTCTVTITVSSAAGVVPGNEVTVKNLVQLDPFSTVSDVQVIQGTTGIVSPIFMQTPLTYDFITTLTVWNWASVAGSVSLIDTYTGTTIWQLPCPANDGHSVSFSPALRHWAGDGAITYATNDDALTVTLSVNGYRRSMTP